MQPEQLGRKRPLCEGLLVASGPSRIGSLGAIVFDNASGAPLLLGVHHVLTEWGCDGSIWQPAPCGKMGCQCSLVGTFLRGRRSIVPWREHWYYIDAAVATIRQDVEWEATCAATSLAKEGARVQKEGASSGLTRGVVTDACHLETVRFGRLQVQVPNQIRLNPAPEGGPFAADGDSGALVREEDGAVIGLLWGADATGVGVACPIGPVLDSLDVRFKEN